MDLATDAVFLRPVSPGDADALARLQRDNREQFEPVGPQRGDEFYTVGGQLSLIMQSTSRDDEAWFGVFERSRVDAPPELVGFIRLSSIVRGVWLNANVGYCIDASRWGRGYATQALQLAVRHAFDELGLHRVQAAVMPDNAASIRVVEKAGFRREGLAESYLRLNGAWRDHLIFAITAPDDD